MEIGNNKWLLQRLYHPVTRAQEMSHAQGHFESVLPKHVSGQIYGSRNKPYVMWEDYDFLIPLWQAQMNLPFSELIQFLFHVSFSIKMSIHPIPEIC